MAESSGDSLSKNDRRQQARDNARKLQEQNQRRQRRNRILTWTGVGVGVVAVIAVVVAVIASSITPAGPGPRNMASAGVQFNTDLTASRTDAVPDAEAAFTPPITTEGVPTVQLYYDFGCPHCIEFEQQLGDYIEQAVVQGKITLVHHPISLPALGASRSSNAALCVADLAPDSFFGFAKNNFAEGLGSQATAENLIGYATAAGATDEAVSECIEDNSFRSWVTTFTDRALAGPIPGTEDLAVSGTPTVVVDGQIVQTDDFVTQLQGWLSES